MEALRDAVGPDIEIMVDFHGRPRPPAAALAYIDALAPGAAAVRRGAAAARRYAGPCAQWPPRRRVPIATGERLVDRCEFDDIVPLARRRHRPARHLPLRRAYRRPRRSPLWPRPPAIGVAPHNPLGPIAGVAALHFAVSTPNHVIQEEMVGAVPWYFDVVQGPIRMVDGYWQIPELPGLGHRGERSRVRPLSLSAGGHPYSQRRTR